MNTDSTPLEPLEEHDAANETPSELVVICEIERIDIDTGEVTGGSTIAVVKK